MKIEILKANSKKGFSFLAGINRPVSPSHVTKLAHSVEAMGIVRPVVVTRIDFLDGKEVDYIIDGQHLYTACLRMNCDIPYTIVKVKNTSELVETIALLNASSKSWSLQDYVQSWKIVKKDYTELESLFQRYDIEISQIAQILHTGTVSNGAWGISKILKKGQLQIKDLQASVDLLDNITDVLKIVPRMDRASNRAFISAYSQFAVQAKYDHKKTLAYLKANKDQLKFMTQDPEEYNKLFHSIK